MRKVVYTTNAVESLHMSLRKIIKMRGSFPTEQAALKLLNLALTKVVAKWETGTIWTPSAGIGSKKPASGGRIAKSRYRRGRCPCRHPDSRHVEEGIGGPPVGIRIEDDLEGAPATRRTAQSVGMEGSVPLCRGRWPGADMKTARRIKRLSVRGERRLEGGQALSY